MKQTPTLSIGIPAYNEGANIKKLLQSVLAQDQTGFTLKEIIVMSDGSSDNSEKQVASLKDKRITFIDDGKRLGKSARLDQIFRTFKGDSLLLIDADILITDKKVIAKTIQDGNLKQSGIVGINAMPLPAKTFFEKTLEAGVMITKETSKAWNNGNNYLSFKGCYLAFDGAFAKKIHMPAAVVNNDSFLYFAAVEKKFTPVYLENCSVYFQSPSKLNDHIKQSSRFDISQNELQQYFKLDLQKLYAIPTNILVLSLLKVFIARPITTLSYIGVNVYSKLRKHTNISSRWSIARSTKGKLSL